MTHATELLWIDAGRQFAFEDMVFWQTAGQQALVQAAAQIDTIVLGPHASAAFPSELKPFVNPELTRRKQCDFSDVLTSTLGRLWAQCDAHTVFVENPHPRLAGDANRAPPVDPMADLREFFVRLARKKMATKCLLPGSMLFVRSPSVGSRCYWSRKAKPSGCNSTRPCTAAWPRVSRPTAPPVSG